LFNDSVKGFNIPFIELLCMKRPTPALITIIAKSNPERMLKDLRVIRNNSKFGNIMDVARQYGVNATPVENGIKCTAPKSRMQMFAEKLHFSGIRYQQI